MNGAESLLRSLVASGVDVCFANPGTSEMHFVAALDKVPGMRPILALQENVATGAADGYGRMAGKPACTLLHLGPGLANGLANLHNARRAETAVVNIVGDHAAAHVQFDALLTSDIKGFASPVSDWIRTSTSACNVGIDAAMAVHAAQQAPGQIATLILPADTAWNAAECVAAPLPQAQRARVDSVTIDHVAGLIRPGVKTAILMRGNALKDPGLEAAGRIAAHTGARLLCDTFTPRVQRGAGRVAVERLPYFSEQVVEFLAGVELIILVGARPPVSFFAYPDKASWLTPSGCRLTVLSHPHEDGVAALEALAEACGSGCARVTTAERLSPTTPHDGPLSPEFIMRVVAKHLPDNAIIADELRLLDSRTTTSPRTPHRTITST